MTRRRSRESRPARRPIGIRPVALGLMLLVAASYAPVRNHQFVNIDDPQYVFENPNVRDGLSAETVRWAFASSHSGNWHPLTWISHAIDVELFGLDAGAHHLVNVAFHAMSTAVLFLALARLTGAIGLAAFAAALFGLHPLRVESVAWIAERKDVLSTFFWLLAMLAYARYAAQRSARRYLAVMVAFACGLMSKPSVVTLPLALLLLDFWPLQRRDLWTCVREKLPLLALSAIVGVITLVVQREGGAVASLDVLPLSTRIGNIGVAYATYLWKMAWPADLAPLYPYEFSPPLPLVVTSWLLVIALTVLAWRYRRPFPAGAVGWTWYVVTLVPMIGLVQVGSQPMADRYTYVPMIGLLIALSWGLRDLLGRINAPRRAAVSAAMIVIALLAALTWRQAQVWRDSVTIWTHAVETHGNYRARANLGQALSLQGRWPEALAVLEEAVRINPEFADSQHHLGFALAARGDQDRAIEHYRQAVRLRPHYPEAQGNLGIALAERGALTEALPHLRAAVRLDPRSRVGRANLALALSNAAREVAEQGDYGKAIAYCEEAIAADSSLLEPRMNLGAIHARRGDRAAALAAYREALRLHPSDSNLQFRISLLEASR